MRSPRPPRPSPAPPQANKAFFTWTAQKDAAPLEIVGGQGATFVTADGAHWLDLGSMVWNANLGHGHPKMREAMMAAAERSLLVMPSAVFPEKTQAAERLLDIAPPGLASGKVFLCLSGAEANENAIKIALQVTGRRKVIFRDRSYHGATLGMLALSGDPRKQGFDVGVSIGVPWADPYLAGPGEGSLEALIQEQGPDTIAAVLLEGVVGANGVYPPPHSYYRNIRQICDRHGILFISDEVLSGFGRTGRWFAVDHDGTSPDLLTCGKGLTGGYAPGGAVIASGRIARHFDDVPLRCGLTNYAHPLTCAAIAAAIDVYKSESLIPKSARLGEWCKRKFPLWTRNRPFIREVRGVGLLWAVELTEPGTNTAASPVRMKRLATTLQDLRIHLHKRDNLVFLAPPLVISEEQLEDGIERLGAALDEVWSR
jgi:taurine---2-oxoglutarate transaminase